MIALLCYEDQNQPIAFNGSGKSPANISISKLREFNLKTISDHSPHAITIPGAVDVLVSIT